LNIVDLTLEGVHDSISLCIGSKPGFELAREEKRQWLESNLPDKAGAKLAYHEGQLAGMLEYSLIEHSPFPIAGKDLLHINCIWVLPSFHKKGLGAELLKSIIREAESRGKRGISVLAYNSPFFMPSSFFLHKGFHSLQVRDLQELMWMELETCKPPIYLLTKFSPTLDPKRVAIDVLYCAQCPWSIKTRERIERVSREFGDDVRVRSIRTDTRNKMESLGDSRKVFLDGKESFLAPPTEEDVRKAVASRIRERDREARFGLHRHEVSIRPGSHHTASTIPVSGETSA
jgi:GNAT superfamily N-acetyltransferase/predicted Rdx family selenoprotein